MVTVFALAGRFVAVRNEPPEALGAALQSGIWG
jgi:hypothetical protein